MNKFIKTGSVLAVFVFMALFSGAVYATQASTDTEVELNVSTVINISTPDTTTINCASLNTLCTANTTITVGTNNITGYTLQLNATSGYSNALTNAATSETIPTLTGAYAAGSFPTNYWGYTGGLDKSGETGGLNCSANYCPILAYQSNDSNYTPNHAIKVTDAPATASNTTITFGAKADITKPSGTYSTSVTFTAVTNAPPVIPATLDTGKTINAKLKSLASGTTQTYSTSDTLVKAIDVHLEAAAPTGFIPSEANTISSSNSRKPIYIIFDNTNDAGIMHFYTEGNQIFLPSDPSYTFYTFHNLSDLSDISNWDTSNATNMKFMFYQVCQDVTPTFALNLSSWDTSSVADMSYTFAGAGYFATTFTLNLSSWDTSSATNMNNMFTYAGESATTWSVTIPPTNGNNISNTTRRIYGQTTSTYGSSPSSSKIFTLAQP